MKKIGLWLGAIAGLVVGGFVAHVLVDKGVDPLIVLVGGMLLTVTSLISAFSAHDKEQQEHNVLRGSVGRLFQGHRQTVNYEGPDGRKGLYEIRPVNRDDI